MLRIRCPFCGVRDHAEFSCEGDASVVWPPVESDDIRAWHRAIFLRRNPAGRHLEYWQHVQGCRIWLVVERDTVTHEICSVQPAHPKLAEMFSPRPTEKA